MTFRAAIAAMALFVLVGCGSPGVTSEVAEPVEEQVSLQVLDFEGIQNLIASHRGRVVVMDAWSTACPPCVAEFPNLVKLSKKYPADVACISLSFDYEGLGTVDEVKGPVLEFLQRQQATFDNVLSNVESDTLYRQFELAAVPAVFIYNRSGELVKRFDNSTGEEFTYEDVEKFLRGLLADSAPPGSRKSPNG